MLARSSYNTGAPFSVQSEPAGDSARSYVSLYSTPVVAGEAPATSEIRPGAESENGVEALVYSTPRRATCESAPSGCFFTPLTRWSECRPSTLMSNTRFTRGAGAPLRAGTAGAALQD